MLHFICHVDTSVVNGYPGTRVGKMVPMTTLVDTCHCVYIFQDVGATPHTDTIIILQAPGDRLAFHAVIAATYYISCHEKTTIMSNCPVHAMYFVSFKMLEQHLIQTQSLFCRPLVTDELSIQSLLQLYILP